MNVKSARRAAEFVKCCSTDAEGRWEVVEVPGHDARLYQVSFLRRDGKLIAQRCECNGEPCKGHRFGLCYHVLAALIKAAEEKGFRLFFCATKERAELVRRTGGTVIEVVSHVSKKSGWILYRSKKLA
jgi:hypothetical protein